MASVRADTGLDDEPSSRCKLSDSDTSLRTGEWVSSAAASTGPSFTHSLDHGAGLYAYHDISAFRDLTQLHQGRHSTVWSAVCQQTGRTVVIKGYSRDSLKSRQLHNVRREISLLRFFRETGCKGVVSLLATFEDKSVIYLVFEACMRGDLYQLLMRNRGSLHEEFVVTKIVFPLLCVLQQLHKLNIVHRDIKPENIFITEDGEVELGDFGLAGHKFQDRMNERVGTLDYMAPEILSIPAHDDTSAPAHDDQHLLASPHRDEDAPRHHHHHSHHRSSSQQQHPQQAQQQYPHGDDGGRVYDEKVDIWAAGVLVYELLVGRPPFEVDDPKETAQLILSGEAGNYPVHISQLARDFVSVALTKNPALRPSAEELLHHAWLRHHFGGKVPDPAEAVGGGVTAGLLKSWLVASWAELASSGPMLLRPTALLPNRLVLSPASSPRKALSTGDDPCLSARMDDDVKPSPQSHDSRKSVPGASEGGSTLSPHDREQLRLNKQQQQQQQQQGSMPGCMDGSQMAADGDMSPGPMDRDRDATANRLGASQYPSRDSSTGSMDQAVPLERTYVRNDSGASASSGVSIASFASLQHVQRSSSVGELGDSDEMSGLVQRSASICPANISRMPPPAVAFPSSTTQLKPVWQSSTAAVGAGSRKTPGKSRFAG